MNAEKFLNIFDNDRVERMTMYVILVVYFAIVYTLSLILFAPSDRGIVPDAQKVRIERLMARHGLIDGVQVVEIHQDGTLWFQRDGERCQLQ